jgi:hypothetical protein
MDEFTRSLQGLQDAVLEACVAQVIEAENDKNDAFIFHSCLFNMFTFYVLLTIN